ncbi:MAG: DUF3574 domain-containing protein [Bryobacteraceae bacterium]
MHKTLLAISLFAFLTARDAPTSATAQTAPEPASGVGSCGPLGAVQMRTTLYFGLMRPAGSPITEQQWRGFVRESVATRFPAGFTIWEADGQWRRSDGRIARERAKVMLVVHEDSPETRATLASLVSDYKRMFQQESVLWETTPVCAAF